jgi:hypothetical protein
MSSEQLAVVTLIGALVSVMASCTSESSDEGVDGGGSGSGGSSGMGGTSGSAGHVAGSSGTAGKAGIADSGVGGHSGTGGSADSGVAGHSGTGGTAGKDAGPPETKLTVVSPNGGKSWTRGTTPTISWTSTGSVGSDVKIELLKAGEVDHTLSASTPNDGSYADWTIPSAQAEGADYRIRITDTHSTITDSSDGEFVIKGPDGSCFTMNVPSDENKPNVAAVFTAAGAATGTWTYQDFSVSPVPTVQLGTGHSVSETFGAGNFKITLTTSATSCSNWLNISAGTPAPGLSLEGFQEWPADHIFRYDISKLNTVPLSSTYTSLMGGPDADPDTIFPRLGFIVPINIVDNNVSYSEFGHINWPQTPLGQHQPFQIPDHMQFQFQGVCSNCDHAFIIINPFLNATTWGNSGYLGGAPLRRPNGLYNVDVAFTQDLNGYYVNPNVGTRTMPPLLRYDEAATDSIGHMVAVAIYEQQEISGGGLWPIFCGTGLTTDASYPPVGQRFRLNTERIKDRIAGRPPIVMSIVHALEKYGMIATDNTGTSGEIDIAAEKNPNWALQGVGWDALSWIHPTDFDAVDESGLMISKDSGKVKANP